jgi:hypothetical protein
MSFATCPEKIARDFAPDPARFGIDIRSRKFWEDSLAVIGKKIERYCKL